MFAWQAHSTFSVSPYFENLAEVTVRRLLVMGVKGWLALGAEFVKFY